MVSNKETSLDTAFNKSLQLAFPPVMVQLLQALLDPTPSFASIAAFLNMDPMLTSTVLHIANSSSYGFSQKITDIQRAAIAIGTGDLFRLVISLALQKKLHPAGKRDPSSLFGDWRLTLWSAIAADAIAERLCPAQRQEAYLAGILKDLPLFLAFCRDDVPPFLEEPRLVTLPTPKQFADELTFWGHTHADLSYDVFQYWGFPDAVAEAVRSHHDLAGVESHPPLSRCIIYATKWAELLHEPDASPDQLIPFELALAKALDFAAENMEKFRAGCAEKFNLIVSQLGIKQAAPETRLHDQSLSAIQNYHFLAIESLSGGGILSLPLFAAALQRQLRVFWGLTTWELYLCPPGTESGSLFRCANGKLMPEERLDHGKASAHPGWQCIHLASSNKKFGFLALPQPKAESADHTSLPMFIHVLAMHFEEQRKRMPTVKMENTEFSGLPLALARLDGACRIKDTTQYFLDIFGLSSVPTNITAKGLLDARLGISLPRWEEMVEGKTHVQGWFTAAPEGHFPGVPTYVATYANPDVQDEFYLVLGDITHISPLQSIALSHSSYLDALFASIEEQVYLLDTSGTIFWSSTGHTSIVGKNIFAISKPAASFKESWNASFLTTLPKAARVQAVVAMGNNTATAYDLVFSPLLDRLGQQVLLVMRPSAPTPAAAEPPRQPGQTDSLTGLYSHSQFHLLLDRESKRAHRADTATGIIYCDIEQFRRVNEMYGYQTGDTILRRAATCLSAVCRTDKDYACRYGGDKFALIVTEATREVLSAVAENLRVQLHESCHGTIAMNMGLTLVRPGEAPSPRLELAVKASKSAKSAENHIYWAK